MSIVRKKNQIVLYLPPPSVPSERIERPPSIADNGSRSRRARSYILPRVIFLGDFHAIGPLVLSVTRKRNLSRDECAPQELKIIYFFFPIYQLNSERSLVTTRVPRAFTDVIIERFSESKKLSDGFV